MKIRISYDFLNLLFFYVFAVLFGQIVELFLDVKITRFFFLIFILFIAYYTMRKKIHWSISTTIILIIGMVYICLYFWVGIVEIQYVYPPVVLAVLEDILSKNIKEKQIVCNNEKVVNLILTYLFINVTLYFSGWIRVIQDTGYHQFKGALPHSNMLGSVLFAFSIIVFWEHGWKAIICKVLIFFLTLTTMSRMYIAAVTLTMLIIIMTKFWKKIPFIVKLIAIVFICLVVGQFVFEMLIKYIPYFGRFNRFLFAQNGRQYLIRAYVDVVKDSSMIDMLIGIPMALRYSNVNIVEFSHSFTENSFVGIFLLFGLTGICIFLKKLKNILGKKHTLQTFIIILIILGTFLTQDTMLSVQTGVNMIVAVYFLFFNDPTNKYFSSKARLSE